MKQRLALYLSLLFLTASVSFAAPRHVYLTWQHEETADNITVNYQTMTGAEPTPPVSEVLYDTESRGGDPTKYQFKAAGSSHKIQDLEDKRDVHWVDLTGLTPGATYYFIAGDAAHGYTAERKFRTISPYAESIRFVTGGDIGVSKDAITLFQHAAKQYPAFGLVGGDIAYANDDLKQIGRWDALLDNWETNMVTPDGFTVPMVMAIGNHEVRGGFSQSPAASRCYLGFFAQGFGESKTYYSRRFGKNVAILALDSGHLASVGGDQSTWADSKLTQYRTVPHRFTVYHVPLYPSHREYEGPQSVMGRKFWGPIFDKHDITAAFENHDHTFKRSKRLRAGVPDPSGILYLGDGCWGQGARSVEPKTRDYLDKQGSIQHFWRVDVMGDRVEYRAVNKAGVVFDVYPSDSYGSEAADQAFELLTHPEAMF